ncbi:MAG: hypothetical protein Q9207_002148 [Kuettlingeria erythrocarpa]
MQMPHKLDEGDNGDIDLAAVDLRGPQPRSEGPKLRPFPHRKAGVRFIKRLDDTANGGDSHVFEVVIARKRYALKIFNFYDPNEDLDAISESDLEVVGLDTFYAQSDPFYNECRAYGRLDESHLNGKVAVRAYGYTTIAAKEVHRLGKEYQVDDWQEDAEEHEYNELPPERHLFRAIIKDIMQDDVRWTHKTVKRMRQDLLRMRERGIYPMDIVSRNYKGGLLVDFSSAMTTPHFYLKMCPDRQYERVMNTDLYDFDEMIKEARVKTWVIAYNKEYLKKLRPRAPDRAKYSK